jgi:hypothetical protein
MKETQTGMVEFGDDIFWKKRASTYSRGEREGEFEWIRE